MIAVLLFFLFELEEEFIEVCVWCWYFIFVYVCVCVGCWGEGCGWGVVGGCGIDRSKA